MIGQPGREICCTNGNTCRKGRGSQANVQVDSEGDLAKARQWVEKINEQVQRGDGHNGGLKLEEKTSTWRSTQLPESKVTNLPSW